MRIRPGSSSSNASPRTVSPRRPRRQPPRPVLDPFEEAVAHAVSLQDPFGESRHHTEDMIIHGQVIGLDQSIDYAWVDGLGARRS